MGGLGANWLYPEFHLHTSKVLYNSCLHPSLFVFHISHKGGIPARTPPPLATHHFSHLLAEEFDVKKKEKRNNTDSQRYELSVNHFCTFPFMLGSKPENTFN